MKIFVNPILIDTNTFQLSFRIQTGGQRLSISLLFLIEYLLVRHVTKAKIIFNS